MNSVSIQSLFGIDIQVSPDQPGYRLPDDLPLPDDFRKEFNEWAAGFFKPKNEVPDGQVLVRQGNTMILNLRTFTALKRELGAKHGSKPFKFDSWVRDHFMERDNDFISLAQARKREVKETNFRFPVTYKRW